MIGRKGQSRKNSSVIVNLIIASCLDSARDRKLQTEQTNIPTTRSTSVNSMSPGYKRNLLVLSRDENITKIHVLSQVRVTAKRRNSGWYLSTQPLDTEDVPRFRSPRRKLVSVILLYG